MRLFFIKADKKIAKKIAGNKIKLGGLDIKKFSDGELQLQVKHKVKSKKVVVVGSTRPPTDNIWQLLMLLNALRVNKIKNIHLIIPYFGYGRQDKVQEWGESLTAQLIAEILKTAGASRIIALDLHSDRVRNFFKVPLKELSALPLFADFFLCNNISDVQVVAPDYGALERAKKLSFLLRNKRDVIVFKKSRPKPNTAKVLSMQSKIKEKNFLIVDDMIDTAGTIMATVRELKKKGAEKIYVAATHPVLSGPAVERLQKAPIEQIIVTDTIPLSKEKHLKKIKVLSVGELIRDNL